MVKILMPAVLADEVSADTDGLIFAANDKIGAAYVSEGMDEFRNSKPTARGSVVQILEWRGTRCTAWIALRTRRGWRISCDSKIVYTADEFWHHVTNHVTIIDGEDLK